MLLKDKLFFERGVWIFDSTESRKAAGVVLRLRAHAYAGTNAGVGEAYQTPAPRSIAHR
jgi:hypothetical protein